MGKKSLSKIVLEKESAVGEEKEKKGESSHHDPFVTISSSSIDDRIARLLLGDHYFTPDPQNSNSTDKTNNIHGNSTHTSSKYSQLLQQPVERRKVIISYFRDGNEDIATEALIQAGFDVVLFEKANTMSKPKFNYYGIWDPADEEHGEGFQEYGMEWVVKRQQSSGDVNNDNGEEAKEKKDANQKQQGKSTSGEEQHGKLSTSDQIGTEPLPSSALQLPRIVRVRDTSLFVPLMSIADGVLSSAGSQLMSECIFADIPQFALYKESDNEQMLNVEMSRRMGSKTTTSSGKTNDGHSSTSSEALKTGDKKTKNRPDDDTIRTTNNDLFADTRVNDAYGSSIECFEEAFSFLTQDSKNDASGPMRLVAARLRGGGNNKKSDKADGVLTKSFSSTDAIPMEPDKFLTSEEELLILRTKGAKIAYSEFNSFIQRARTSSASKAYYGDLFSRLANGNAQNSGGDRKDGKGGGKKKNVKKKNTEESETLLEPDNSSHFSKNQKQSEAKTSKQQQQRRAGNKVVDSGANDKFRGMPDAAAVICEILKEVLNGD